MMATVYRVCTTPLPISEAIKLLQDPPEEGIPLYLQRRPKQEKYIFTNQETICTKVREGMTMLTHKIYLQ